MMGGTSRGKPSLGRTSDQKRDMLPKAEQTRPKNAEEKAAVTTAPRLMLRFREVDFAPTHSAACGGAVKG